MPEKLLLIIGYTWPEPDSTAAGNRMLQLVQFFLQNKYRIVFSSTAGETERSFDLNSLGVEKKTIQLNDSAFDGFVTGLNPDIVLFDRFLTEEQFGWRVAESVPKALRILDTEDLHSLRTAREAALMKRIPFTKEAWLRHEMAKREIASIYRCDLSLIISSYEVHLLIETLKINERILLHLPFLMDGIHKTRTEEWLDFENREDFICIGNGKHAPNRNAIVWLKKEIWPKIRKELPLAKLLVYGAYLPLAIEQMHNLKEGFLIKGWVSNADAVMGKAKVNLAPLRFGAGIKGKLILAMQNGTPSVTTSIGGEGMHKGLPWSGKIADSADEIAQSAISLYNYRNDWYQAQQNGVSIINKLYRKEDLYKRLSTKIKYLRQNLALHRNQNFVGSLLQHQTMQGTKYLSKWIEAKNSKK